MLSAGIFLEDAAPHLVALDRAEERAEIALAEREVVLALDDPRLVLSTSEVRGRASVHLNDFESKKQAILEKLGFGWLPEHVAGPELDEGVLRVLDFSGGAKHVLLPRLYHREGLALGRAGRALVAALGA